MWASSHNTADSCCEGAHAKLWGKTLVDWGNLFQPSQQSLLVERVFYVGKLFYKTLMRKLHSRNPMDSMVLNRTKN